MSEFNVHPDRLKVLLPQMEQLEANLKSNKRELTVIRDGLRLGSGTHGIKLALNARIEEIGHEAESVHRLKEGMEDIIRRYLFTEALITKNYGILAAIAGDKIQDILSDISGDTLAAIQKWLEDNKNKQNNVIDRINDKDTRDGFSKEYRDTLQTIYDDVPPEYMDARDLYDKHSKDVIVSEFDADGAYHSGGKLHLDETGDLNNKRGDGTTYYHEYGHFVVYKEGWVKNGKTHGQFKEFEASLKKEVSEYIKRYEDRYRQEGIEKGYVGVQLQAYITQETKRAIKVDINGPNNEYYHVNDGLSDIIDGVSNDKYQASYGHNPSENGVTYWDANSTRVSNEAFAEIFSAQMTGDTTEIEKMKEIFPETYKIYMDMINNAKQSG